jgi:histidyl-tRNA synthetase
VFFVLDEGAPRGMVTRWLAELRAAGISCDTDYAGRSLKGQLTQAARLGSRQTVVVRVEGATLRQTGAEDVELPHGAVVSRLLG